MAEFSLDAIAQHLRGECVGARDTLIAGISSIDRAKSATLTFVNQEKLLDKLDDTAVAAVIIRPQWRGRVKIPAILVADPYLAYAQASQLFSVRPNLMPSSHASALIHSSVSIAAGVEIAAGAVIEAGAVIGEGCYIGPNTVVGANAIIGSRSKLFANVSIYHGVRIGTDCEVASGTVIGSDGFGFAPSNNGWQPIAQNGGVVIGDRVFIGANTTIDRGAIEATIIADGVIIDNQVQIAHNVVVGENTAIAGCAGIAGSAVIGKNCLIGGGAGIVGHIEICDGVTVSACTRVTKSISEPGIYASGTPFMKVKDWRKAAARFSRSFKIKS